PWILTTVNTIESPIFADSRDRLACLIDTHRKGRNSQVSLDFEPPLGARIGCRSGKSANDSLPLALRLTLRPAASCRAKPLHFLPFPHPPLPLPPGPNGSQGGPRGR